MRKKRTLSYWLRRVLLAGIAVILVFTAFCVVAAIRVQRRAKNLIASAEQIQSNSDAQHWIDACRKAGVDCSEGVSPDKLGHAYVLKVSNAPLSTFGLIPSTEILVQVITVADELKEVLVGMYTGNSSVWFQKEFGLPAEEPSVFIERNQSGQPLKALVMFSAGRAPAYVQQRFGINVNCLTKFGGCKLVQMCPSVGQFHS
jgi:hypothetical protein